MAITLPRNALIKFTNLNTYAQRNLREITGYSASGGYITFYTQSTSGIINGSTVVISNMPGAPASIWTFTVSNVTATSFRTSSTASLVWGISTLRCYKTSGPMYYLDSILNGTTTIKAGDTITLSAGASFPSGSQTVAIATNTELILKSGSIFVGGTESLYPDYSSGTNDVAPGGAGTLTLNTTAATRTPGLTGVYWAPGGGSSSLTLSDHSRAPLDISTESIENSSRVVSGLMRKSHVASKSTFSTSWELLPADSVATVDGYAGGQDLLNMWANNTGSFNMEVYNRDSARKGSAPDAIYKVFIRDFSRSIVKRNVYSPDGNLTDYWDVQLSLEEE